jgi:tetratricopeptide (TPR) repeat protein
VRSIDVAPTLLELAGLDDALGLGGSLLPALAGRGPVPSDTAYCESLRPQLSHGAAPLKAWRTRDAKFIWAPEPERYDLVADPRERVNRATAATTERDRGRLADLVERVRADAAPAALPAESLDEEQTERLRSLGYAGRIPHVAERLPMAEELSVAGLDPKWIVDVAMAGRDLEVGLLDEARRKLQRFLETAPDPEARPEVRPLWSSAHGNLALLALQEGDPDEAAREYRRALAFDPENADAREGRVRSLLEGGSFREALDESEAMLALRPGDTRLRVFRALALALTGRLEDSRAAFVELDREGCPPDVRETAAYCRQRLEAGDPSGLRSLLAIR